jgi:hypothetical protein
MLSTEHFNYDKTSKTFIQEVSSLPSFRWEFFPKGDKGFTLISHKTTKKVKFALYKQDTSHEGETTGWRLRPIDSEIKKNPKLEGVTVLIINS